MMMKLICSSQVVLALLVCLGACAAVDVGHLTGSNSRDQLYEIISATEGTPIEPELTLEVLKRYQETLGKYDFEDVRSMIEVAYVDPSKCNGPAFRRINEQLKRRKTWSLNMVPYLMDAKRRQFEVCRDLLSHKMLESVEELSKKQVLQLDSIMKSVQDVKQASLVEPLMAADEWFQQIHEVLLVWFKRQFDLTLIKNSENFDIKKRSEFGSCYSIMSEFTGPIQAYEAVMDDVEIVRLIDRQTLDWITKYNLCTSIVELDYSQLVANDESSSSSESPKKKSKSIWKNKLFKSSWGN